MTLNDLKCDPLKSLGTLLEGGEHLKFSVLRNIFSKKFKFASKYDVSVSLKIFVKFVQNFVEIKFIKPCSNY